MEAPKLRKLPKVLSSPAILQTQTSLMTALALTSEGKDRILPGSTLSCTIRSKRNGISTWGPLNGDKAPLSMRDQTKSQRVARKVHSAEDSPTILWKHGQASHQGSILAMHLPGADWPICFITSTAWAASYFSCLLLMLSRTTSPGIRDSRVFCFKIVIEDSAKTQV